jgi:hypothetical protein
MTNQAIPQIRRRRSNSVRLEIQPAAARPIMVRLTAPKDTAKFERRCGGRKAEQLLFGAARSTPRRLAAALEWDRYMVFEK